MRYIIPIVSALCIVCLFSTMPLGAAGWQFFLRRGNAHFDARLYKFALEDYSRALEYNPKLTVAANRIGDIFLMKKNVLEALFYYKKSLNVSDSQPKVHLKAGKLYEYLYQPVTAFAHFKKAARDPSLSEAHLKLVPYYIRRGNTTSGELHLKKSFTLNRGRSRPFIQKAEKAERGGDITTAEAMYRRALQKNPAHLDLYFRLSRISRRKKKFRNAVRYLHSVIAIRPDHEKAYMELAHLYFNAPLSRNKKMMIDISLKSIEKVLSLNPRSTGAYILLSDIHRYLGNKVEARKYEKKAAELERSGNP